MSRTALVTDGTRGIGAAIAEALADAGYSLAVNYAVGNGGAKLDHGSGGEVPSRRSKTLPVWPFPATGRAEGCIARYAWRAGRG